MSVKMGESGFTGIPFRFGGHDLLLGFFLGGWGCLRCCQSFWILAWEDGFDELFDLYS